MNLSEIITNIKMSIGIYGLATPFEDIDKTITDVLKVKTLKSFSQYNPDIVELRLDLKELECLENTYNESIYLLPDVFGERDILYIRDVQHVDNMFGGPSSGYLMPPTNMSMLSYQNLMMGQANADLMSFATPGQTFKFTPPNKVHLYNASALNGIMKIQLALDHSNNLSTLSPTVRDSFLRLAILDVKAFLYSSLKHYNDLSTAYGNIALRIDDWSSAEDQREDLINQWSEVYHLDTEQIMIV